MGFSLFFSIYFSILHYYILGFHAFFILLLLAMRGVFLAGTCLRFVVSCLWIYGIARHEQWQYHVVCFTTFYTATSILQSSFAYMSHSFV